MLLAPAMSIKAAALLTPGAGGGLGRRRFGRLPADRLANQRLTDKDQLARPFDLPVAAHPAHRNVRAIVRILDPIAIGSRQRPVQRSRRLLSQRLVRPLMII